MAAGDCTGDDGTAAKSNAPDVGCVGCTDTGYESGCDDDGKEEHHHHEMDGTSHYDRYLLDLTEAQQRQMRPWRLEYSWRIQFVLLRSTDNAAAQRRWCRMRHRFCHHHGCYDRSSSLVAAAMRMMKTGVKSFGGIDTDRKMLMRRDGKLQKVEMKTSASRWVRLDWWDCYYWRCC